MRMMLSALALAVAISTPVQAHERWILQIHGGAGTIERDEMTPEQDAAIRGALEEALAAGAAILDSGGSALDAVEAAVRVLEDAPQFNAGRGAVLNTEGMAELDASIMEGTGRNAGAVAGATRTKNPITVARAAMEQSPHVMFAGPRIEDFAASIGAELVDRDYFLTPDRLEQLERRRASEQASIPPGPDAKRGTVGAVAMDSEGRLAAATSTGGTSAKLPGRIGDSPIIGAGTYADDRACAVSATGWGEYYIRTGVAHEICARIRLLGEDAQTAADAVQAETLALGGAGGVIVLDNQGRAAFSFNTSGMYRGRIAADTQAMVAIYGDE